MQNHASRLANHRQTRRTLLGGAAALGAGAAGFRIDLKDLGAGCDRNQHDGLGQPARKGKRRQGPAGLRGTESRHLASTGFTSPLPQTSKSRSRPRSPEATLPTFSGRRHYRDFVVLGAAMDVTEQLHADPVLGAPDYFLQPQETERATVNDKWFGIGSCWVAPHIYYNADLLAEAGIDPPSPNPAEAWTFDHFREVGRAADVRLEGPASR